MNARDPSTVRGSFFLDNNANEGGAIYNRTQLSITRSVVAVNTAAP